MSDRGQETSDWTADGESYVTSPTNIATALSESDNVKKWITWAATTIYTTRPHEPDNNKPGK